MTLENFSKSILILNNYIVFQIILTLGEVTHQYNQVWRSHFASNEIDVYRYLILT